MHDALTIGIPAFVILLGILFNRTELRDLKADMVCRFEESDKRFDTRFAEVEMRFDNRFAEVQRRFDSIDRRLDGIDNRLNVIEGDLKMFDGISSKLQGRWTNSCAAQCLPITTSAKLA